MNDSIAILDVKHSLLKHQDMHLLLIFFSFGRFYACLPSFYLWRGLRVLRVFVRSWGSKRFVHTSSVVIEIQQILVLYFN
jgi:hypothetical protein